MKVAKFVAKKLGIPENLVRSQEEMQQFAQQMQQMMQQQQSQEPTGTSTRQRAYGSMYGKPQKKRKT